MRVNTSLSYTLAQHLRSESVGESKGGKGTKGGVGGRGGVVVDAGGQRRGKGMFTVLSVVINVFLVLLYLRAEMSAGVSDSKFHGHGQLAEGGAVSQLAGGLEFTQSFVAARSQFELVYARFVTRLGRRLTSIHSWFY